MLYHTKINTGGYLITNLVAGGHRPHISTVAVVYGFRDIVRWYYNKFSEPHKGAWVQNSTGEQYFNDYNINNVTRAKVFPDYSEEGIPVAVNPSLPDYPRGI
jgi:hypothetical protein